MVTKTEWETDLRNTRQETEAYRMLSQGYAILAQLPENITNGSALLYAMKAAAFNQSHQECGNFLAKLEKFGEQFNE
jgi:hypothetical protein